ncbi:MAG: universal stress protein [Deltaproteobacteria bacterium]|nr:universal stress protein [Deltaproteobacteria bacterium]
MKIQKLLFVTQFEELWFDALQSLMDLRKDALGHVIFLNVIERDKVALRRGVGYQKEEEIKLREKANIRFIDWAETLFEQGTVEEIQKAVHDCMATMLITGTSTKGLIKKRLVKSIPQTLSENRDLPIFLLPPTEQ